MQGKLEHKRELKHFFAAYSGEEGGKEAGTSYYIPWMRLWES